MAENRSKGLLGILFLIGVFFLLFVVFAIYTLRTLSPDYDEGLSLDNSKVKEPIAVVEVDGAIMGSKDIIEKLHIAEEREEIKAIILRVNSPGGAVGPTQEIFREIRRIDAKKPIYASFGSIAASGGYYIGAAARKIYANAGTLTGSIGVIMGFMDMSELYKFAKVRPEVIKAGRYKDTGNPHRGMTEEEKKLYTGMLAGVHQQFIDHILEVRKERIQGDIREYAQGQIFSGETAKTNGLVDEIGSLWEAGRQIHAELELKGKFGFKFIKLKKKMSWTDIVENLDESVTNFRLLLQSQRQPLFLHQ